MFFKRASRSQRAEPTHFVMDPRRRAYSDCFMPAGSEPIPPYQRTTLPVCFPDISAPIDPVVMYTWLLTDKQKAYLLGKSKEAPKVTSVDALINALRSRDTAAAMSHLGDMAQNANWYYYAYRLFTEGKLTLNQLVSLQLWASAHQHATLYGMKFAIVSASPDGEGTSGEQDWSVGIEVTCRARYYSVDTFFPSDLMTYDPAIGATYRTPSAAGLANMIAASHGAFSPIYMLSASPEIPFVIFQGLQIDHHRPVFAPLPESIMIALANVELWPPAFDRKHYSAHGAISSPWYFAMHDVFHALYIGKVHQFRDSASATRWPLLIQSNIELLVLQLLGNTIDKQAQQWKVDSVNAVVDNHENTGFGSFMPSSITMGSGCIISVASRGALPNPWELKPLLGGREECLYAVYCQDEKKFYLIYRVDNSCRTIIDPATTTLGGLYSIPEEEAIDLFSKIFDLLSDEAPESLQENPVKLHQLHLYFFIALNWNFWNLFALPNTAASRTEIMFEPKAMMAKQIFLYLCLKNNEALRLEWDKAAQVLQSQPVFADMEQSMAVQAYLNPSAEFKALFPGLNFDNAYAQSFLPHMIVPKPEAEAGEAAASRIRRRP